MILVKDSQLADEILGLLMICCESKARNIEMRAKCSILMKMHRKSCSDLECPCRNIVRLFAEEQVGHQRKHALTHNSEPRVSPQPVHPGNVSEDADFDRSDDHNPILDFVDLNQEKVYL